MRSTPFTYAVMPDSLLSFDQVCDFYGRVQTAYKERLGSGTYLGQRPGLSWRPIAATHSPDWLNTGEVAGVIETAEVALDLEKMRRELEAGLETAPGIVLRYGWRVGAAERVASGFRVAGSTSDGESWERNADIVVNCLWEGRLQLDESMGMLRIGRGCTG